MTDRSRVTRRGALRSIGAAVLVGSTVPGGWVAGTTDAQEGPPGGLSAREATVRIESIGTYDFPDFGTFEVGSGGSGFLISESGVAVTANHVVTGAATLEVSVGTDTEETYNAQVLGASECSDLAVIRLTGSGFGSLSFASTPAPAGTEVFAHGFPAGSDRVSTTDGIVSRTDVGGETNWASVDSVIEHTARITFGSSGGPLVDREGAVVGVNYAGIEATDQNLALGSDLASGLVATLREGRDVEYVGINGVAVESPVALTPDGIQRAIHVISVETGSPAFEAGIRAGDRILRVENTQAVRSAAESPFPTKQFYCDVVRTRGADQPIAVQVLRQLPNQVGGGLLLEGTINGEPLTVVGTIDSPGAPYGSFGQVSDDTGVITVEVPTAWTDVRGVASSIGPQLVASPDVNGYFNTWDVPGTFVAVTDQGGTDVDGTLDALSFGGCATSSRSEFTNGRYTGRTERFDGCGPGTASAVNFAALPGDGAFLVFGNVQLVAARDEEALSRVLETVTVTNFAGTGAGADGGGGAGAGGDGGAGGGGDGGADGGGDGGAGDGGAGGGDGDGAADLADALPWRAGT